MPIAEELRSIPLFSSLSYEEQGTLASLMETRSIEKGEHAILAEDERHELMFVARGRVKVSLSGDEGKEVILAYLDEGDFFGEIALLTASTRSADVVAVEKTNIFVLRKEDFEQYVVKHPGLAMGLLTTMAERLREASGRISDLALLDVYRRVSRALRSIATEEENGSWKIEKRPTHQELAAVAGTSREMVTRALKSLESEGYIQVEGKTITFAELPM